MNTHANRTLYFTSFVLFSGGLSLIAIAVALGQNPPPQPTLPGQRVPPTLPARTQPVMPGSQPPQPTLPGQRIPPTAISPRPPMLPSTRTWTSTATATSTWTGTWTSTSTQTQF